MFSFCITVTEITRWMERNQTRILWNFPNCLGVVDEKHVAIKKHVHSGSFYYNTKKFLSIVMIDSSQCKLWVYCGWCRNYWANIRSAILRSNLVESSPGFAFDLQNRESNNSLRILEPAILSNNQKKLPFVSNDGQFNETLRPNTLLKKNWINLTYCTVSRKGSNDFRGILLFTQLFTKSLDTDILQQATRFLQGGILTKGTWKGPSMVAQNAPTRSLEILTVISLTMNARFYGSLKLFHNVNITTTYCIDLLNK